MENITILAKSIADIMSKIGSINRSVVANYASLNSSISAVQSSIGQVDRSVADLSRSVAELNGAVSSMYSLSRQLEGRLDSAYLALEASLAVAVVALVVAVLAWRKPSRQSAGGYDVCG
jgi:conjugal transfer/entry exclusion protein